MTGIARPQLLPAPGTGSGALAVVTPGQADRRVKPVVPAATLQRGRQDLQRAAQRQDRIDADWRRQGQVAGSGGRGRDGTASQDRAATAEAATGRSINFSRLSSMPFMVQVLGQEASDARAQAVRPQTSLTGHRDAALLGSEIYRKAGGEPELLPDAATFVRLAV